MKVPFCRPVPDDDVASVVPPKLAQAVAKGLPHVADCRRHRWSQDADTLKLCLLLRLNDERRSEDAPTHQSDECSSVHQSLLTGRFRQPARAETAGWSNREPWRS